MNAVRIISLGGFTKVTENLYAYHFLPDGKEENDQILVVDCGVGFPEEDKLGVDLVIPDVSYLEKRKEKIVGVLLTHGHEDHIGALPFVMPVLSEHTPIFGSRLTVALAKIKLEEFGIKNRLIVFNHQETLRLGVFAIDFARVTHSLPDSFHFLIQTPAGNFYHGSDFKFDLTPPDGVKSDLGKIADMAKKRVTVLLSDCLGSEKEGHSPSETTLNKIFENEFQNSKGRVFVTAISSNVYRWQRAIDVSKRFGRKIALVGLSIEKNINVTKELGYLNFDNRDIVEYKKALKMPDNQVTFLIAGSLGQTGSSLERVILGKHKIVIKEGDKVIFSSPDYIPGTSSAINRLINSLIDQGAEVVYREMGEPLHVSGHGSRQELALLANLVSPEYVLPIGGERKHVHSYAGLAEEIGFRKNQIIMPKSGEVPTFWSNGQVDLNFKFKERMVLIDGLGIGDVGKTVLRDRKILAKEGMIVIIILTDNKTKLLSEKPMVVSRGFVYVKESKVLLGQIEEETARVFSEASVPIFDIDNIRYQIQSRVEQFVYEKTGRQPMVLPVLLEV